VSIKVTVVEAVFENDKGRFSYRSLEAEGNDPAVISGLFGDRARSTTSAGLTNENASPSSTRGLAGPRRDAGCPAETASVRGVK
jgi:hypothetical protein